MQFNWIDGVVLAAYFISMLALGLYQTKKIKGTGDFFAGGRKFNKFLMMMHALGTGTHADDPVGVTGASYKNGFSGIWYTFVYLFVTPFFWIIAPLFRRSRFLTTADFFEARFGSSLGTLYAIWGILIFSVNMGMLLIGTGKIVTAVSLGSVDPSWGIAGMVVAFLIYGTAGGLVATVVTESVQGLLIVVMSLMLVPFGLHAIGGFHGMHHALSKGMFSLTGDLELDTWWILAGFALNLINIVAQPHTMELCATGKTEFEGRIGFTYGNFVKRLCALGWCVTGLIVAAMIAQGTIGGIAREDAFGTAIRHLLPAGLVGLMFAAILAAQMSTLSAFMVAASALFSRNVYKKHFNRAADDTQILGMARYAGLVVVGLGVVFAFCVTGVADAIMWFWTMSAFTGLFMWAGVLWKKTNATGAWASFCVMLVIWLVICEPGAAINARIASGRLAPVTTASIERLDSEVKPFSQILVDRVKTGPKGPERKNVAITMTSLPKGSGRLGFTVRPLEEADKGKLGLIPGAKGAVVDKPVDGVLVTKVIKHSISAKCGLAEGDVILGSAPMNFVGIFGDKNLLAFRFVSLIPAGLIALVLGSLLGRPHPKEKLDRFYALLRTPVGREDQLVEQGVEAVYVGSNKGHPWELNHQKLVNVLGFAIALVLSSAFFAALWWLTKIGA